MDEESSLDEYLIERGCICHCGHPPCSFCTSLNEEEADVYANHGRVGLREFFNRPRIEDFNIW